MKKQNRIIMAILLAILLLSFSGCFNKSVEYEDGSFFQELEYDDRGWKSTIQVEVQDGKIIDVSYEEINESGELKSEDEEYGEIMKQTTGVSPIEAFSKLENNLLKKQRIDKVDIVSGATYSSENFIKLLKKSLTEKPKE